MTSLAVVLSTVAGVFVGRAGKVSEKDCAGKREEYDKLVEQKLVVITTEFTSLRRELGTQFEAINEKLDAYKPGKET